MPATGFDLLHGLERIRSDDAVDAAARRNAILAAAGALTLATEAAQPACWELLRDLAARALPHLQPSAAGEAAVIAGFLAETNWAGIAHLIRRDRHLWNTCLHVVRQDGAWLVCDGLFDGVLLLVGSAGQAAAARVGDHAERANSEAAIAREISEGLHLNGQGRTPPLEILFQNGRPVDQSQALAKFCGFLEEIEVSGRLHLHFLRSTMFFDPAMLERVGKITGRYFFDGRPSLRFGRKIDSIVQSFYLPYDNSEIARRSSQYLANELGARYAPPADRVAGRGLRLFVSLELEKRIWVEQVEALELLFSRLLERVPELGVVVNGMTGTIFGNEDARFVPIAAYEREVIAGWQARFGPQLQVQYLGGLSLTAKLETAATCDFFAAPAVTAAWIPLLAGVPGVFYISPDSQALVEAEFRVFSYGRLICRNQTVPVTDQKGFIDYAWAREDAHSYSIRPEIFVAEVMLGLSRHPRFSHL